MKILIVPAAGQGQRFRDAGYKLPKPLLGIRDPFNKTGPAAHYPMLVAAAIPFDYWADEAILVIPKEQALEYRDEWDKIYKAFITRMDLSIISYPQEGAALTIISLTGEIPDDAEVLIVNSDQFFLKGTNAWLTTLHNSSAPDGSMLTFEPFDKEDRRWSYAQVAPHDPTLVTRVAEKIPISTHATAGAYYFRQWRVLRTAICRMVAQGERYNGEFYLAPAYNQLIKAGMTVRRFGLEPGAMVCVGTPDQYEAWNNGTS
jgi:UDP-N-acetylglucosamine diphosphorylase / glucose-1-phosphate thymidylyltransferase / UDP-N-acetylgalactosamine diphosphorylase / glucosamine-1-phosphate N-acetyltransferase / galactosamine-1-phosphate N-acetyltransferase